MTLNLKGIEVIRKKKIGTILHVDIVQINFGKNMPICRHNSNKIWKEHPELNLITID
jgi:hypothetical protein